MNLDVAALLLGKDLLGKEGNVDSTIIFSHKVVGIYFSAHWCPPCRNFTPVLVEFYKKIKEVQPNFEIIFCSSDKTKTEFDEYYAIMPWLAIPHGCERIQKLKTAAGIQGIPTLIFVNPQTGQILHDEGEGTEIVYNEGDDIVLNWTFEESD